MGYCHANSLGMGDDDSCSRYRRRTELALIRLFTLTFRDCCDCRGMSDGAGHARRRTVPNLLDRAWQFAAGNDRSTRPYSSA